MKLLTKEIEEKLIKNFKKNAKDGGGIDHKPVVKFFGGGACTWLITEYDPESRIYFGLCDLGMGFPEPGYVSRDELEAIRFPPYNLPVERDMHFKADKTLIQYAYEATKKGSIAA